MANFLENALGAVQNLSRSTLNPRDTIQGSLGDFWANIAGVPRRVGTLKNFEAKDTINSVKIGILGQVNKGTKTVSVEGKWTLSCYLCQSDWSAVLGVFRATGHMPEIRFLVSNHDTTSNAGAAFIAYTGVTLDEVTVQKLDVDDAVLEQSISGSYESFFQTKFHNPFIQGMF